MKKWGMLTVLIGALAIALGGCVTAGTMRSEMEASKDTYKSCLDANADNVHACDIARLKYEADVKSYAAIPASRGVIQ